jgi:23S rRNA (guanosine2251-2'-O)-methyltransferase
MEWLYGRNVVKLALQAGRRAHRVAATPAGVKALGPVPHDLPVETRAARDLDELCGSREHQGVALLVDPFRYVSAKDVLRSDMVVVLDEVSDPHNLGAVARSALAAGAGGLVVPRHRSAVVTPAAVKASAGAIELLPVAQVTNTVAFLKQAKDAGFWVYGAAAAARTSYLELDLTGRVVLVFGAEGHGLRPLVMRTCDALAAVPIAPRVESLNVSVAAALFLFEARRQTSLKPGATPSSRHGRVCAGGSGTQPCAAAPETATTGSGLSGAAAGGEAGRNRSKRGRGGKSEARGS